MGCGAGRARRGWSQPGIGLLRDQRGQGRKIRRFAVVWLRKTFSSGLQIRHGILQAGRGWNVLRVHRELAGIGSREAGIEEDGGGGMWWGCWGCSVSKAGEPTGGDWAGAGPAQGPPHRPGTGWKLLQSPSKGILILLSKGRRQLRSPRFGVRRWWELLPGGESGFRLDCRNNPGTSGFKCPFWGFLPCWIKPSSSQKPRAWEQFLEQLSFPPLP